MGIVNFFNKTENKSIGSLDNATGVAILLELARFFKNYNDIKSNLIFLFTSSEELNLGGAIDYFNKHQKELSKENTYIINYDLAGGHNEIRILTAHGIPKKSIKNELTDLFLKIGKEQGLDVREYYIPTGAWVDNLVFANNGFKTIWVGSGGVMKYVHSKKDNMEIVSKTGLKNVLELTLKLIKELESKT
ncbi:MAG: M28 family metallopeptidase [Promethearchaeota archaeon]